MSKCDTCKKTGCFHRSSTVVGCSQYVAKDKTNADRIRAMSDEEFAEWLFAVMSHKVACFGEGFFPYTPCRNEEHDCVKCGIKWLKQPAEE